MKILILTSIYKGPDIPKEFTPVVHEFANYWKLSGHEVLVIHNIPYYPSIFYFIAFFFRHLIANLTGTNIPSKRLNKKLEYKIDNINVIRLPIYKTRPYSKFSLKRLKNQKKLILNELRNYNFRPDIITGHWGNPQLKLIAMIKSNFINVKTGLVLHSDWKHLQKTYPKSFFNDLKKINKIGFRNRSLMDSFTQSNNNFQTFICNSGVPDYFFTENDLDYRSSFNSFIFIGTFIKRKYPIVLLNALYKVFGSDFILRYIGSGFMKKEIKNKTIKLGLKSVKIYENLGRIEIKSLLDKSDCLIMISENEAFGLVYLEAMSRGCIVIASKKEGMDGIIIDGFNGFLCEAGNEDELCQLLKKISKLNASEIIKIKNNAVKSAKNYTYEKAALIYLNNILK